MKELHTAWVELVGNPRGRNDPGYWAVRLMNGTTVWLAAEMLALSGTLWFRRFDEDGVLISTIGYPLTSVLSFEPTDSNYTPLVTDWAAS